MNSYKKYGHFSQDNKEFIITRPDTPAPWVNYISNGRYSGLISHTGGGYSFYLNPKDNRITRWRYNSLPVDRPGRYILIRDQESGSYWSPTWQPTQTQLSHYRCRHGLYYTQIDSRYEQVSVSLLYFVPPQDDLEIWKIRIKNLSDRQKILNLFAFQELCLGHALVDLINQPNDQHFNTVSFDQQHQILLATKRYWVKYRKATVEQPNETWNKTVFFASDHPIKGYDGSKERFIGRWRSEANPYAVKQGHCRNSEITSGDAIGALQTAVTLVAGEEKEAAFFMGILPKKQAAKRAVEIVHKYRKKENRDRAFRNLQDNWQDYLDHIEISTADQDMNRMLNTWNQYQTAVTFQFSRDASYYHGGLLFGRGFRDSCQDIMGPVMCRPEWVRQRITEMAGYQFKNGSTFHLYFPTSGTGERTGHTDTPLWLPLAIMVYLKETGDFDLLSETVPFYDQGSATIRDHLFAAIDYTLANLTNRYLAKFGPGDWNDTLDYLGREGKGESVWVSMFLAYILKEATTLCRYLEDTTQAAKYESEYQKVKSAINRHCWDGQWYIRATNDQGDLVGSSKNKEGKIFLNTQSWAVISGVAEGERAIQCMQSVTQHLETPKGPKILNPPYTRPDDHIGLVTRCVPGKKENGAVFNHPVSWSILAYCLLGDADRAFTIYKKALPMNPEIDIDRYSVEPYVYAEYVTSPDHPTYGQASHSWLTGSSAWMLRSGIDYILGIRPTYQGLQIDPCIPRKWSDYRVVRKFRGKTYQIEVQNPKHISQGIVQLECEGHTIKGNIINLADPQLKKQIADKPELRIRVCMG